LGAPGFVREDADARVWQYRGAGCVLDAFLYPYRQADEDTFIGPAASAPARRAPWRESQGAGWPRPAPEGTKASPFVGSPVSDALAEPYRVTYYEIRGDAGDDRARRRCFRSLLPAGEQG
ncbi:MAG: hypothetical protein IIA73_11890, partial [Proteobacteria bacterium]|nr:hypothetical protein [Pseudomonadota bacterium]